MVVRRPEFSIRRVAVQSQCHGRPFDNKVVVRACIARAITLSKRVGAIQSYRWIALISPGDQNICIEGPSDVFGSAS
jgi:hypothetical protein